MADLTGNEYKNIAIGDIGTQLFSLKETYSDTPDANTGDYSVTAATFEYGVPVTAGAEFGGDTESFDAPETDLDYIPKVMGRKSLKEIEYTINYTAEKYQRVLDITTLQDHQNNRTFMEVFSDGSAFIFQGTAPTPTITSGDVRQITLTIVPTFMKWVSDIYALTAEDKKGLETKWYTENKLNINVGSIPNYRPEYYAAKNA